MLKAVLTDSDDNQPPTLVLGLSFANLREFRDKPLDTFIKIEGASMGLAFNVMIISGETEKQMAELITTHLNHKPAREA